MTYASNRSFVDEPPEGRKATVDSDRPASDAFAEIALVHQAGLVAKLHFHFKPADKWYGELIATVSADEFAGRGSGWFTIDELRSFVEAVAAYPLPKEVPVSIVGSVGGPVTASEPVHLSISFEPHDAGGRVRVTAILASSVWTSESEDLACSVTARFLVTYADLSCFASAFSNFVDGRDTKATLQSSVDR